MPGNSVVLTSTTVVSHWSVPTGRARGVCHEGVTGVVETNCDTSQPHWSCPADNASGWVWRSETSDVGDGVREMAIELDDPTHLTADGRRRDRMKDAVCEAAGFELLRIESSALRPGPRGRRLVEYLIDARAYCQDYAEAQEAGHVPFDEPAMYSGVIDRTLPILRTGRHRCATIAPWVSFATGWSPWMAISSWRR